MFKEHPKYQKGILKTKEELIELAKGQGRERIFHVLSFGGGTQSGHLSNKVVKPLALVMGI